MGTVVMLALGARLAVMVPALGRPPEDPDQYLPLARSVAEGRGLALRGRLTAYRPPLYPLVLTPLVTTLGGDEGRVFRGVLGLHLALGAGTVGLVALAGRRWGLSPTRILAAAAVVALDPVLVVQARAVMTETLAAFLLAVALAALADPRPRCGAALGGLAYGLASLCRPSLLPAALLTAAAAIGCGPGSGRDRLGRAALILAMTVATLAPWAARNALLFGEPVWTTTHGGYTLALANNPVYYADVLNGPPSAVWSGPNQARWFEEVNRRMAGLPEPEADRRFRALGLAMLRERPADFARASAARLGRFWGLSPAAAVYPRALRWAIAAWTAPLWLALLAGLLRRDSWRWPRVAAPAALLALTAVHALFWTDLRMRAPLVPALALLAASAGHPGAEGRGGGEKNRKKWPHSAVQIPSRR